MEIIILTDKSILVNAEVIIEYGHSSEIPINAKVTGGPNQNNQYTYLIMGTIPVEILTVHFIKRTMRVRYIINSYGKNKITTVDIDASPFFNQYKITGR
jgi:hypothetical protein